MRGLSHPRAPCIGEETLAAFAEGRVDGRAHGDIEEHLADCDDCRAVLARAAGVEVARPDLSTLSAGSSERDAGVLAPGARVGRYVVQRLIGRGAMGTVYAAADPDLDRNVAVKLLRAGGALDAGGRRTRARLLREAQAMARLSHPEVITVYDVGACGDELFVAMEYVEGETLKSWCRRESRPWAEVLAVYERAGRGLAAAHEAGLVHRDFKPDNVLVARDGRVRVTDFGLARSVERHDEAVAPAPQDARSSESIVLTTTLTRPGTLVGTPAYMAPEQLAGKAADARSDIFSFCVALYEALYGERPFVGSTVLVLRASIEQGTVRPAPPLSRVPARIRGILLRGLRAAPDERWASMSALLGALQSVERTARPRLLVRSAIALVATAALVVGTRLVARGPSVAEHDEPATFESLRVVTDNIRHDFHADLGEPPRDIGMTAGGAPSSVSASLLPLTQSPSLAPPPSGSGGTKHPAGTLSPPRLRVAPRSAAPRVGNNGAFILE